MGSVNRGCRVAIAVSLLRGINVGGHKKIKMADLRELYASLGFRQVRSLLQTGNVVFETDEADMALVKARLEAGIADRFGFAVPLIMRSPAAFKSVFKRHPFTDAQLAEPRKIAVVFLPEAASAKAVETLRQGNPGREFIQADGSELFVFYTDGQARSKLDNSRIERALGLPSTARNWNTCNRLMKLLEDLETQAIRST